MTLTWMDAARAVGRVAPVLGTALAGSAGGAVGELVATALGVSPTPEALIGASADPEQQVRLLEIQQDHRREILKLHLEAEARAAAEETARLSDINTTMRAELLTQGIYKSGWRPAIGWVLAGSFAWLAFALGVSLLREPSQLPAIMDGIITLVVAMGTVLGVNISARKTENLAKLGQAPTSFMDAIKTRVARPVGK